MQVPAGIDDGQRLRLAGRGPAATRGGEPGDLYVSIAVRPHPRFERDGDDLLHVLRLPMTQAALGAHLRIETLDGEEDLLIPTGTQTGRTPCHRIVHFPSHDAPVPLGTITRVQIETAFPHSLLGSLVAA